MPSPRKILLAAISVLCAAGAVAQVDDPLAAQRAEFQQARARVAEAGGTESSDSASLQAYVLYPYLQAARLEQALRAAAATVPAALDEQVSTFLRTHDREVVAQDLRRSWLASLAARARWPEFLALHREASDELALRCQGYTARIELGRTEGLAEQVARTWLTPRSLLDCDRAFSWLETTGNLPADLIERRVRLALEAGSADFARQIAARLPAERSVPLLQWAALLENPQREIDALIAVPERAVEPAALLAGWTKLARANRTAARQRLERLVRARQLDKAAASPLALALALALSWDRDDAALRYFAQVAPRDFDDNAREWQARAALWADDWKQVSRSIAAMTETNRNSARWRYWAARAAAHDGRRDAARQLYEALLTDDNYYSAMAAARLKQDAVPHPHAVPPNDELIASLEKVPAFERARELYRAGIQDKARLEWSIGLNQLAPTTRVQTIRLAMRWGWYPQAVAAASGEQVFFDYELLYPRPYDAEVDAAAKLSKLEPTLIYSVIRQESLYQKDAESSARARGLMQLTIDTAQRTARNWKRPSPSASDLFDPATNVALGAAHLRDLLDRFDQLPLALAAYNAGPGAAQRWLPDDDIDADIWIENIPYNETRAYVQRILWHTVVFQWLDGQKATDTREWLRDLEP